MKELPCSRLKLLASTVAAFVLVSTTLLPVVKVHAANVNVTVDGSQHFQTMDGFGVNANSASWNNGELKPVIDKLADEGGSTIWRVVVDDQDWEATNDDSDYNHFNWSYYNTVYTNPKFENLWSTIAYLNQKPNSKVILCPMGKAAAWMGGLSLTANSTIENEYAEMISSMAYYGHITRGLQFTLEPNNEPDIQYEGIGMDYPVYAYVANAIAQKLDANGMSDMRMMGPSAGVSFWNVTRYMPPLWSYPALMAHLDNYSLHDYDGTTSGADASIKSSPYPNKHFYMTEFAQFTDGFAELGEGPTGLLVWDGYDSVYNHPLDHGGPSTAPNDASNDGPALLAYNSNSNTYTPRKEFYQFEQLFKYVPAGSVRVGTNSGDSSIKTYAFQDPSSSRLTLVGNNTSTSSQTLSIALNNLGATPNSLSYYQTNSSSNMTQGADVTVSGGIATVTVPASTIFTLTGTSAPDTSAPTVAISSPQNNSTIGGTQNVSVSASDNVAATKVEWYLDGSLQGSSLSSSSTFSWNTHTTPNGSHILSAKAYDAAGNIGTSPNTTVNIANDNTAPSTPANLSGLSSGFTQAQLSWDASTDDTGVAGYHIWRNGSQIGSVTTTAFTDTGLTSGATYTYAISAYDASGNESSQTSPISVTTDSDTEAPAVSISAPSNGASISGTVNVTANATDNAGVVGVQFRLDGAMLGTEDTSAPYGFSWNTTSATNGTHTLTAVARDSAGNSTVSAPIQVVINNSATSIWASTSTPVKSNSGSSSAIELGLKFRSDVSGKVTAIRFYKSSTNTGTHLGHLWSSSGTQLANVTFSGESASGWQQANLSSPVSITANTTYVVSYYAPKGHNASDSNYFASQGVDNTPLHALKNGVDGNNGVYRTGTGGGFPTTSSLSSNYWVDIVFAADAPPPPDTTAPTVSISSPGSGSNLSGTQNINLSASDNVGVSKVEWYLDGALQASKTTSPYSFSWNTLAVSNGPHSLSAKAYDAAGNIGTSTATNINVYNDTMPPSAPANLTANVISQNQVDLNWDASSDDVGVTNYIVKRNGVTIAQPTSTNYSDTSLTANTTYTYTIYAVDGSGNQSAVSNSAVATTPPPPPDTTPPTVPLNLASSNTTTNSTTLSWNASSDNVGVSGYQIFRDGVAVGTTSSPSFTDTGLQSATTYSYSVKAYDAAGNYSDTSSSINVTTVYVDTVAPQVSITAPSNGSSVNGTVNITANASDNIGVTGVKFFVDGTLLGSEDTASPYTASWNTLSVSSGTHVLTAVARDTAGNSSTSTAVSVTVNNLVMPISTDVNVSSHSTSAAATIVSPTFNTSSANELLVAFISSDGPSSGAQTIKSVTGGGLTWTLAKRTNTRAGTSEIWTAMASAQVTNAKVTASLNSGSYVGSITVVSFIGAKGVGATASANAATGAPSISLTATQSGSWVWAVGNDWDKAASRTVPSGQTLVDQYLASVGDTFWVQRLNNLSTAAGQTLTINDTSPTTDRWNLAAIEILPQ
jgi:chitodextrinase